MGLIDLNYGDINYSDSESFWWETVKNLPAVIPVLAGFYMHYLYTKKEKKEKLIVKLFNFKEHLTPIIASSDKIMSSFEPFSKAILEKPFDEHLMKPRIFNPDLSRITEMHQESLFDAFYLTCEDKVQASRMFRQANNQLEFYKFVVEILYMKYDEISKDIYNQKIRFRDDSNIIYYKAVKIMFDNNETNTSGNQIELIIKNYEAIKTENTKKSQNLDFIYDNLIIPLIDQLVTFEREPEISELYVHLAQIKLLKETIVKDSLDLGNLIKDNISSIPDCIVKLIEVRDFLDLKLKTK